MYLIPFLPGAKAHQVLAWAMFGTLLFAGFLWAHDPTILPARWAPVHPSNASLAFDLPPVIQAGGGALDDIGKVHARLARGYLSAPDAAEDKVAGWLAAMDGEGKWAEIKYGDLNSGMDHLRRLKSMARSWRREDSSLRKSPKLLEAIARGLRWWFGAELKGGSFYQVLIEHPLAVAPTLVLLRDDLPRDLVVQGAGYLNDLAIMDGAMKAMLARHFKGEFQAEPYYLKGQNRVWFAQQLVIRGALRRSAEDIQTGIKNLCDEIRIVDDEGLQSDGSFHMHSRQLYSGGYGIGYLGDPIKLAVVVNGTRFGFPKEKLDLLTGYFLHGHAWTLRGQNIDFSTMGREISRPSASRRGPWFLGTLTNLAWLDPANLPAYQAALHAILGVGVLSPRLGHTHFWKSDYTAHAREGWATTVRMFSPKVKGTEAGNGENQQSFWMPYGMNLFYVTGSEYDDIFPVWDWAHLPGVTCPEVAIAAPGGFYNQREFVGGVSDGWCGVTAMDFEGKQFKITGKKAWFLFDDEVVALGTGIRSQHEAAVNTTLNQCLLREPPMVDGAPFGGEEGTLDSPRWVHHDRIGYVFPESQPVQIRVGARTADTTVINKLYPSQKVTRKVFGLWIPHGTKPQGASYAYVVVPGIQPDAMAAYRKALPVTILSNGEDIQAVRHGGLKRIGAVFRAPGHLDLGGGDGVEVDQPCILGLHEGPDGWTVSLSDPTRKLAAVNVRLVSRGKALEVPFDLPTDEFQGGKTVTKTVRVPVRTSP